MLTTKERAAEAANRWRNASKPTSLESCIATALEEASAEAVELVRQLRLCAVGVVGVDVVALTSVVDEFLRAHGVG